MADPRDLTIATAMESCGDDYPHDEYCGICQERLSDPAGLEPGLPTDNEVVRPYACGYHYFHCKCLMGWLNSTTPPLNLCPLDRRVLFGTAPVQQPLDVNSVPTFADFPGHATDRHDPYFTGVAEVLQERARIAEHARTRGSPASIGLPAPVVRTEVEQVLHDSRMAAAARILNFYAEAEAQQARREGRIATIRMRLREAEARQDRDREAQRASQLRIRALEAELAIREAESHALLNENIRVLEDEIAARLVEQDASRLRRIDTVQELAEGEAGENLNAGEDRTRPSRVDSASPDPSRWRDITPSSSPEDLPAPTDEEAIWDGDYLMDFFDREDEEPDYMISPAALARLRANRSVPPPRSIQPPRSVPPPRVQIPDSEEHEVPEEDEVSRGQYDPMPDDNNDEFDDADHMHWMSH
jgi:hypothetical protein